MALDAQGNPIALSEVEKMLVNLNKSGLTLRVRIAIPLGKTRESLSDRVSVITDEELSAAIYNYFFDTVAVSDKKHWYLIKNMTLD